MRLGFIGFGEVSFNFICGMVGALNDFIYVYDTDYEKATKQREIIKPNDKIIVEISLQKLVEDAEVVLIAIHGNMDESLFDEILKCNKHNKLFIDLCTASPITKKRIEEKIAIYDGLYVDVAVMGSVPKLKHQVPMLVSGSGSDRFIDLFNGYRMKIKKVGNVAGEASTVKLCRSIYMKGLAALLIETKIVSEAYGVSEEVFESLADSMNADSFEVYSERLIKGTYIHCKRRKEEVENSMQLIMKLGLKGYMTEGTIQLYNEILSAEQEEHKNE